MFVRLDKPWQADMVLKRFAAVKQEERQQRKQLSGEQQPAPLLPTQMYIGEVLTDAQLKVRSRLLNEHKNMIDVAQQKKVRWMFDKNKHCLKLFWKAGDKPEVLCIGGKSNTV